jgi:LPPG:FO 2-phospho-L-lactate transferase
MKVLALAGGVGGAKLAHGLYRALPPDALSVVVNTGDDFDLYHLRVCPDADTVLYTLAGLANEETGWGLRDETWSALAMLARYGEPTWFRVGDRDLTTDVLRTARLRDGWTPTRVVQAFAEALGVRATLLPMCDEPTPTMVRTPAGELAFQDYFVRRQHRDTVLGVRFAGIEAARVPEGVRAAIAGAEAVVFCPSNPMVSIGPILAVPGMRVLLRAASAPRVAVSPIVGGRALRGPADRMLADLGSEPTAYGVAALYRDLLDGFVLDVRDAAEAERIQALGMRTLTTDTVMATVDHRERLARDVLRFVGSLREEPEREKAGD